MLLSELNEAWDAEQAELAAIEAEYGDLFKKLDEDAKEWTKAQLEAAKVAAADESSIIEVTTILPMEDVGTLEQDLEESLELLGDVNTLLGFLMDSKLHKEMLALMEPVTRAEALRLIHRITTFLNQWDFKE